MRFSVAAIFLLLATLVNADSSRGNSDAAAANGKSDPDKYAEALRIAEKQLAAAQELLAAAEAEVLAEGGTLDDDDEDQEGDTAFDEDADGDEKHETEGKKTHGTCEDPFLIKTAMMMRRRRRRRRR